MDKCRNCGREVYQTNGVWHHRIKYSYDGGMFEYKAIYCTQEGSNWKMAEPETKTDKYNNLYDRIK